MATIHRLLAAIRATARSCLVAAPAALPPGLSRRRVLGVMVALTLAGSAGSLATGAGAERIASGATSGAAPPSSVVPVDPAAAAAQASTAVPVTGPSRLLALTPPMGWNGFNHFGIHVTAAIVEAAARALVHSGLAIAGYRYVNLDGGWDLAQRSAQGALQPDPAKFPNGIRPVADYVHSLGLKFGIYASAGTQNCAHTSAGSYGHYRQDAATFASWGADYLKLDWCYIPYRSYPGLTRAQVGQMLGGQMAEALAATGRPIVYDVNDTTSDAVWGWGQRAAHLWRTGADIRASYASIVRNFLGDVRHHVHAGPGHWNDPDMLEVGNGSLSSIECVTHLSLWAELAAPLIAGNDLATMPAAVRAVLTNRAVIAVDQDRLGQQGYPVQSGHGLWVLTKPLANGDRAVLLFNQTNVAATISTSATQVGLKTASRYSLLDLWTGALTTTTGAISAVVPPHGVVMDRLSVDRTR